LNENLKKGLQKKKGKIINMLSKSLLIRHKPTKIEYTIQKVVINGKEPLIIAYRYYSKPSNDKKVFVSIPMQDFKQYEMV
jgi:predicted transcriptional regulator